ncbi:MAG: LLM class F420-dependent oxidoreductase, partial [Actinobacteria bacterium]|nr:LLM class F420-dependent oxidoreductase [Actinomycetota bacterium]
DGAPEPRAIGQIPICWDTDAEAAKARAHEQFRWFGGGWAVNADLPTPAGFAAASQFVTPDDVPESIPCGPDLDAHVGAVHSFLDAGFSDVAVVQVGGESQPAFLEWAEREFIPALRAG